MNKKELLLTANEVRKGIIVGTFHAKSGHPGGSLSAAECIVYLYFNVMNIDPKDPEKPDRDRFVLSKGHAAPALYAVLAERGYFPKEELETLRHFGMTVKIVFKTGGNVLTLRNDFDGRQLGVSTGELG